MMRNPLLLTFYFLAAMTVSAQTVQVSAKVNVNKRQAELEIKKAQEEERARKTYFAESSNCGSLIRSKKLVEAETSCVKSLEAAEKLPKENNLEKSHAYLLMGYLRLRQNDGKDAAVWAKKALQGIKLTSDETQAEIGEIYFLLGQAYHLQKSIEQAEDSYIKAENVYRAAYLKIDDDELRQIYVRSIVNILKMHYLLLNNAQLVEKASAIKVRLTATEKEFAKYLEQ